MKGFLNIAHIIGSSSVLAQGQGGNISFKKKDVMLVKASGCLLKDIQEQRGYVTCFHAPIKDYLFTLSSLPSDPEFALNALIEQHTHPQKSFGIASIETGMHAVIPSRFVIHTHPVYLNVFMCMQEGRGFISTIFQGQDFLYIPYANPGFFLSRVLAKEAEKIKNIPSVIFLENHGLITHHDNAHIALALTQDIVKRAAEYLKEKKAFQLFSVTKNESGQYDDKHVFPDSAVYLYHRETERIEKNTAYAETASAVAYIMETVQALGGTLRFLSSEDVAYIRGMDKEKMRREMSMR